MSQKPSRKQLSRRNILQKSASGAVVGIPGLSQLAVAKRDASIRELKEIEEYPEVQSILAELNYNSLPRRYDIEVTEITTESANTSRITVDFGYGTLQVAGKDEARIAIFSFDTKNRDEDPHFKKIPREYRRIPEESEAWLLSAGTELDFFRTATEVEKETALSKTAVENAEEVTVYTTPYSDGFHVDIPGETDIRVDPDGNVIESDVRIQFISSPIKKAARSVANRAASMLGWKSIDQADDTCGSKAASCLNSITALYDCSLCKPLCATGATAGGAAACVLCVYLQCSSLLSVTGCAGAVNCLEDGM